jgi:hypothetical protein
MVAEFPHFVLLCTFGLCKFFVRINNRLHLLMDIENIIAFWGKITLVNEAQMPYMLWLQTPKAIVLGNDHFPDWGK